MKSTGNNVADGVYDKGFGPCADHYGVIEEDTALCDYCQCTHPESEIHKLSNDCDVCICCVRDKPKDYFYESELTKEEQEQLYKEIQKIIANI